MRCSTCLGELLIKLLQVRPNIYLVIAMVAVVVLLSCLRGIFIAIHCVGSRAMIGHRKKRRRVYFVLLPPLTTQQAYGNEFNPQLYRITVEPLRGGLGGAWRDCQCLMWFPASH